MSQKSLFHQPFKGFTLIELLVSVAIVGLLAALLLVSIDNMRARSRDNRRLADMKALRDTLAAYQITHSTYPAQPTEAFITGSDAMSQELLNEKLIQSIPLDPLNIVKDGVTYRYTYQSLSNNAVYVIKYCLETNYIPGQTKGCGHEIKP